MIKTEQEYICTKKQAQKFLDAYWAFNKKAMVNAGIDENLVDAQKQATLFKYQELIGQIEEYEKELESSKEFDEFTIHEALHMASFLMRSIDCELLENKFIKATPEVSDLIKSGFDSLFKAYQKIGSIHLGDLSDDI